MARVRNSFWSKQIDKLVQSENIPVVFKKYLNFGIDGGETGYGFRDESGVIQWKNSGGTWTNISAGGGGGSAHVIQDEGTPLTQRGNLNFVGSGVTVTDGGAGPDSTIVTVTAGSGLKLPTLTVGASGADYTTIQGALDAIGVNGGKIYLTDATYTITSAITFKGSGVEIVGNSNGTQINADGAVVTTLVTTNATTYQRIAIRDVTFNQTNGTVQGIGIDFSNISLAIIKNVRILNFGTALKLNNTTNNNFYSHYEDIKISGCNNGIDCTSTTPFNFNTFINIRTALRAGGAGTGLILNNAQGNGFYNFNAEPATGAGITGVAMTTANVFDNNFYNLYCENNDIGVTMDSNTQRNNFYGGNVIASITTNFIDSGKYNQRYGLNVGTTVDYRNVYSNTRFVSTGAAPITLSDFTNNTSFAHSAGSLVNMSLLNTTDTSDTLEVANASTTTGLALDIKNSFGFSRGTNFSTVGSSNNVTFSNHSYIRCNGASAQTITGIANGKDGRYLVLRNTTANPLTLNHEDTNSTATNRLICPGAVNYVVVAGASVTLIYDPSDTRWALLIPDTATGTGDVVGPASATDNAIARFDTTTGKLIQNSSSVVSDSGDITSGNATGNRFLYLEAGSTRRGKITQEGASAISPLRISSNGSLQLEVDDTPVMTIADTGPVTFSQTVAVPDDAFAASWNSSVNVPTKNAVYDQMILKSSALYVTVGDSTTNFPVASYADVGAAINAAYAALPADGGTIFIQNGTYSYTTPIVFGTNAKIASLVGSSAASTILKYTPTSGNAITINHGETSGRHRQHEIARFTLMGTSSLVYVGTVNTRTSIGLFLGGTNGCPAINVHDMTINGFGTQIETGQALYMARFNALSLSGGNGVTGTGTGLQGSLVHINSAVNSGERIVFTDCTFSDPCNSEAENAVYVESSGAASLIFKNCSFDNTQLRVIGTTHTVVDSCHVENPTAATYGEYVPFYFDSYNAGTLVFRDNQIVDSQTNPALNFANIIRHGVNLFASNTHFSNYGGQSHARMFDCTLSTANEAESISGTVVEGGGVVEIARNWAYTAPRGIGSFQNYRNSWNTGFVANADNTVNWKVGSDVNALTADAIGNLTTPASVAVGTTVELGHASDTTLSRVSAGVIAVEGVNVSMVGHTHTAANITDFTEASQDAVGAMAANSTFVSLAYNDATPALTPSLSATGTPDSTKFLRGDNTWATPGGSGDMVLASAQTNTGLKTFLDATFGLRNVANTITSLFTNAATVARTWTFPDKNGTVAMTSDITGTNSGVNTGDQTSIVGITGTLAQFSTAVTDADLARIDAAQTFTGVQTFSGNIIAPKIGLNSAANLGNAYIEGKTLSAGSVQGLRLEADNAANIQFSSFLTGDSFTRFSFLADGTLKFGDGTVSPDTNLYRNASNSLMTDDKFTALGGLKILNASTSGYVWTATDTIGNGSWQAAAGGGGGSTSVYTNQTPDNGTYALLSGTVNGSNTVFTVNGGIYTTGTLTVYLNGQLQTQGASNDWQETTPASGTFTFITAPQTGDIITVQFQTTASTPTSLTTTEIEVDFGTKPTRSKRFTITDAGVSATTKILAVSSGSVATGRVGDDHEWDSISYACRSGTGQFTLTGLASGRIRGKRKVYYTTA